MRRFATRLMIIGLLFGLAPADASVKFAANTAYTSILLPTSARSYTECFWWQLSSATADQTLVSFRDAGGTGNNIDFENTGSGVVDWTTGAGVIKATRTVAANSWFFDCATSSGTGANGFVAYWSAAGGSGAATLSTGTATYAGCPTTFDTSFIGKDQSGDNYTGTLACLKYWNAILTAQEIQNEQYHCMPQRIANLAAFYPLFNHTDGLNDYGNSHHTATAGGTAAADGTTSPPIPFN